MRENGDQLCARVWLEVEEARGLREGECESGRMANLAPEPVEEHAAGVDIVAIAVFGGVGLHAAAEAIDRPHGDRRKPQLFREKLRAPAITPFFRCLMPAHTCA